MTRDNINLLHAFRRFNEATQNLVKELEVANYHASLRYPLNKSFDEVAEELSGWVSTQILILENRE